MKQIAITIIEVGNIKSPNVGTIVGTTEIELNEKAKLAIESHFDAEVLGILFQDELDFISIINCPPIDIYVTIDNYGEKEEHHLEIQQTCIY